MLRQIMLVENNKKEAREKKWDENRLVGGVGIKEDVLLGPLSLL